MRWYAERKIITGRWCPTLYAEEPTESGPEGQFRPIRRKTLLDRGHEHLTPVQAAAVYGSEAVFRGARR